MTSAAICGSKSSHESTQLHGEGTTQGANVGRGSLSLETSCWAIVPDTPSGSPSLVSRTLCSSASALLAGDSIQLFSVLCRALMSSTVPGIW